MRRKDKIKIRFTARGRDILLKWVRLIVGLVVLAVTVLFFSSGYSPPGFAGEVLRHNQQLRIDASPLFYSEVENMSELEDGIRDIRNLRKAMEKGRSK